MDQEYFSSRLATHLAREIADFLAEILTGTNKENWLATISQKLSSPECLGEFLTAALPERAALLWEINEKRDTDTPRPDTPLAVSALLTGASRSPALRIQLQKELASCDRADWLVSFIKYAGIVPLMETLRRFTARPAPDGGPRLRIATTSYMGATEDKAIEELLKLANTEIRVSYDTKRTRLHAKAYLFHRETGFSAAYIGSANVSKAALDEGLEWTAKISQYETLHLWQHAVATFESHWEDSTEFSPCQSVDLPRLRKAIAAERGISGDETTTFFDFHPYEYQRAILEDIAAERVAGKDKHLIIAATGTGKTIVAAFDYKGFCEKVGGRPRLLFVAHREEILKQARATFRQVLRDGSFGDLVIGGADASQEDHLFCTVQSWNSRDLDQYAPSYFDYVVLDEAHHGAAKTYQKLISHVKPKTLIGLTATPERTDGADIRNDFDGAFTHELRLPEAIDRALLSPFHYYGIPDLEGLDFSGVAWKRGGYDFRELAGLLEGNRARANWVLSQLDRYMAGIDQVRGLGFCVSVNHAVFMAEHFTQNGLPSLALTGESSREDRRQAQRRLEQRDIRFIFTVDLYNEGVDIPCVDTVLFLRPTESLTLFLQQLGRGLRLHESKSHLTVLDFIAPQSKNFRFAKRFQALSSRPELRVDTQIERDMPFVPAGCLIHLERQAREYILRNIKEASQSLRGERLLEELRELKRHVTGNPNLGEILDFLHLDSPDDLYRRGMPCELLARAEGGEPDAAVVEFQLAKGCRRLLLMDDTTLIGQARDLVKENPDSYGVTSSLVHTVLWGDKKPERGTLQDAEEFLRVRPALRKDLQELFEWLLEHRTPIGPTRFQEKSGPLVLHASYTREQVLLALGCGSFERPRSSREGVFHVSDRKLDVFFADVEKTESDYSPTTMYEDYAITDRLFHWQSQSTTSDTSETGRRYIEHAQRGYTPLLFLRHRNRLANKLTAPYVFAGPLQYVKHEGSRPMSVIWRLEHPLPAKMLSWARKIA